ncbi:MAG TPA: SGNH/GDSL hydrolase family protein [Opitutaceae bacterium]|nr:SGNH/GDSL hydrolase family protein [Opitutaceae bacterium]
MKCNSTHLVLSPLRRVRSLALGFGLVCAAMSLTLARAADRPFYLQPNDRVCFYGDSITEQRYYGMDVETFVRTRFPGLQVEFVNSGVGGDRVTGGWAGRIDLRLERDVFPFKPNVVTIMLGMNDASYRPFDEKIFATYTAGYEHIIESLQAHLPGVRIVLIQPTPYDDITQPPKFPGGYNAVLLRYSAFVRELAEKHHLECVDFMTPLVNVVTQAHAENPTLATKILPGRIHPSALGELVMAQALLQAWNAPAVVTSVSIDGAAGRVVHATNTSVTSVAVANGGVSWSQQDTCLPFPILGLHDTWWQFPPTQRDWGAMTFYTPAPKPDWNKIEPEAEQVLRLSGFYAALDQQPLKVSGLKPGGYALTINGTAVGTFTSDQLAAGVNLAEHHTPMLEQAYGVLDLVWKQTAWRFFAWRGIQTQLSFDHDPTVQRAAGDLVSALEAQGQEIGRKTYTAAQPKPTTYALTPVEGK